MKVNYEYGPFGEVIRASGPMAKLNPFTFQTEVYDWETDKLYVKNRYYDPSTGRFLSRDPIGEKGGANLYAFVDNNPVVYLDPFGLSGSGLGFSSDGEYYFDGHIFGYTSQGSASGLQTGTLSAWFSQSGTVQNCPNGFCNSGGTGSSSSFVTANIANVSKCPINLHCVCNVSWSGSTTTFKYNTGAFTAKGTVLGGSFNHPYSSTGSGTPPVFTSSGSGNYAQQQDFTLGVGGHKELYNAYIVESVGNVPGDAFSGAMSGGCTCTTR